MRALTLQLLAVIITIPAYVNAQGRIQSESDSEHSDFDYSCKSDADCMSFEHCDDGECVYYIAEWRKGLEMELRAGLSVCAETYNPCEGRVGEIKPGGGGGIFVGIRPNARLAVGIDFGYFAFSHDLARGYYSTFNANHYDPDVPEVPVGDSDYSYIIRFLNIMPEIRGYVPYGYKRSGFGDIYFKLGVGYLSFKEEYSFELDEMVDIYPKRLYSFFNLKMGLGTTFYFVQDSAKGDMGLGLSADYLIFYSKDDVDCGSRHRTTGYVGDYYGLECNEIDGYSSRLHTVQITAHFKWVLPIKGL